MFLKGGLNWPRQSVVPHCEEDIERYLAFNNLGDLQRMAKSFQLSIPPEYAMRRLISSAMKSASSCSLRHDRRNGLGPDGCDVKRPFSMRLSSIRSSIQSGAESQTFVGTTLGHNRMRNGQNGACGAVVLFQENLLGARKIWIGSSQSLLRYHRVAAMSTFLHFG